MGSFADVADKYLDKAFKFGGKILTAIKWLFIFIFVIIFIYGCYTVFGYLFFVGFFICAPISLLFFNKFLSVPSKHIWECQLIDEKENTRERIGLLKMPLKIIGKVKKEGGNISSIDSVSGKPVMIVEKYDEKNNTFIKHWIDKVSSYEFFAREEGHFELQEWVRSTLRKVVRLLANWKIYQSIELKQVYDDVDYTTDIKELEKSFLEMDKYVFDKPKEEDKKKDKST